MKPKYLCAAMFAALLLSQTVYAQTPTPTNGVPLPDTSLVTRDDATAIETNPAGLGFMRTAELGYGFRLPVEDLEGVIAEGHALFFAVGSGFLSAGFGLQWMKRPELGGDFQTYRKYTFSVAKSFRSLSLGSSIHWFGSSDSPQLDKLVAFDLGLQLRIRDWFGFGMTLKDANTPFLTDTVSLPLRLQFGAAIRLFGGRVTIDPAFETSARDRYMRFVPRLVVEPVDGLRVFGNMSYRVNRAPDVVETNFESFGAGLSFSLGAIGGDYAAQFEQTNLSDTPRFAGIGAYTWISPFKQRSLIDGKKWIVVDLSKPYPEMPLKGFFSPGGPSFLSVLNKIRTASEDPKVDGLVFSLGDGRVSWSKAWELREAIQNARSAGKETLALMGSNGLQQYYIASTAEKVWITPTDTFQLGGLRGRSLTIRGALQKLGVEAQFVRIGDYKSSPEMFLVDEPSKEAFEQKDAYIEAFWKEAVAAIASSRGKTEKEVLELLNGDGLYPDEAQEKGWVDRIVYSDEADKSFRDVFGKRAALVRAYPAPETREQRWKGDPTIAVVVVEGNIVSGKSGNVPFIGGRMVGDQTVEKTLAALGQSSRVKAVVVRIDSPGGSAAASDRMYRALRKLAAKKPVIASMSGTAASGGYYVAAGADEIWATPTTVTGSIGIFSGTFNGTELFDRIGIKEHRNERGNPVAFSAFQRWDDAQLAAVKKSINYLYRLFLHQAASTRPMEPGDLDKLARGRVWVGSKAKEMKLVDYEGGIHAAIARAEELADLKPGRAQVTLVSMGGGGFSLDFVKSKIKESPETQVIRKMLAPFATAIAVPLLYESGEALMLGDGLVDGSN